MTKFITANNLNSALSDLIKEAQSFLYFFSPFIKISKRLKDELSSKMENDELEIAIVFGKNENDPSKSIHKDDIAFLKTFPNISIYYKDTLHAKYYSSESKAIITSMNLYDYSQTNNIESGVLITAPNFLSKIASAGDNEAENTYKDSLDYFRGVMKQSNLLFRAEPQYESKMFGFKTVYTGTKIIEDNWDNSAQVKQEPNKKAELEKGYCIRTGVQIPFNTERPMSYEAYQKWGQFKNMDYPEKYCHRTGKLSNGKTSMRNPIL